MRSLTAEIENVSIDNHSDLEYEFWDFDYCASVLRSPVCSTCPGQVVCDGFTSISRSGKYKFVTFAFRRSL